MPTVYVQIQCAAADRAAVEADLSAHGSYPLSVPLTTYPGDSEAAATHYGANISCVMNGALHAALLAISASYPGSAVQTVQMTSPYYRAFSKPVHWTAWLQSQALQEQTQPV